MAKSKKQKKEKKSKKLKKKTTKLSNSESDEDLWIEKDFHSDHLPNDSSSRINRNKSTSPVGDNWLDNIIPTYSRSDLKDKEQSESDVLSTLDHPGHHPNELNPYWKDGGAGLPSTNDAEDLSHVSSDSLPWLLKAYERCEEISAQTSEKFEDVVAERWGSLERLEHMIAVARASRLGSTSKSSDYHPSARHSKDRRSLNRPTASSKSELKHNLDHVRHTTHSTCEFRPTECTKLGHQDDRSTKAISRASKSTCFMKPDDDDDDTEDYFKTSLTSSKNFEPSYKLPKRTKNPEKSLSNESASQVCSDEKLDIRDANEGDKNDDVIVLTEAELNELGAKVLKAELMGNMELVKTLKKKLEKAQKAQDVPQNKKSSPAHGNVPAMDSGAEWLTRTTHKGMVLPLEFERESSGDNRKRKIATHGKDGERERYFADDDKYDLQTLVKHEKKDIGENVDFIALASKVKRLPTDNESYVDDLVLDKVATSSKSQSKIDNSHRLKAIYEHQKRADVFSKCKYCFERTKKHLVIAVGKNVYISVPDHSSLTDGHCFIIPIHHASCSTALDEDVFLELKAFRKKLVNLFSKQGLDCIVMEMARSFKRHPHMKVEIIPLPRELGDQAPIYFKKALLECESMWAQNKKVIELKNRDIRQAVPKGFEYFSVDFGHESGFAHVIEDDRMFPEYFGREIVGGLIDAEPVLWRKPKEDSFERQTSKSLSLSRAWKSFTRSDDSV